MYWRVFWVDSEGDLHIEEYASRTEAVARKHELARAGVEADIREVR